MEPQLLPPPPGSVPAPPADRTAERARTVGTAAAGAVGLGAVLLVGRAVGVHAPACPFLAATGVPCPFCGITRLTDAMVHLRVGDAVGASPAGVVLIVGLAVIAAVFGWARLRHRAPPRWLGSPALLVVGAAVLAVHWATSIATGLPSW